MAGAEECPRRGRTKEWEEQRLTLTTKAPYKPDVAVCILPGTELAFERDVEYDHLLGFFPRRQLHERVARFRQVNMNDPSKHHDALEFPSGGGGSVAPVIRRSARDGSTSARHGRPRASRGQRRGPSRSAGGSPRPGHH